MPGVRTLRYRWYSLRTWGAKVPCGAVAVEGIGYFCEDEGMEDKAGALDETNEVDCLAEVAGIEMSEFDVIRTIARGLSVMRGKGHQKGDAKNESYGFAPVGWICDWVDEVAYAKFRTTSDSSDDADD